MTPTRISGKFRSFLAMSGPFQGQWEAPHLKIPQILPPQLLYKAERQGQAKIEYFLPMSVNFQGRKHDIIFYKYLSLTSVRFRGHKQKIRFIQYSMISM